jgi:pimeloyl-ACP methyl ester carboxylesterase
MRPWRQISVLVAAALALAACGSDASGDVVAPTRPVVSSTPSDPTSTPASASATAAREAGLATFYDQKVEWHNCGQADCAHMAVPIDYAEPDGATVQLAAARVEATGEKIGTLFVDPGGPGGSAVDYAKAADLIVSPAIREHYDIVGVDPRGVGKSEPVRCLTDQETDDILAVDGTPDSAAEEQQTLDVSLAVGEACAKNGGLLYAHMGTGEVARDMDIARAVVNDETFNYLGKSYGSMIGATYAELFPDRVGRMVLDGVLPASLDLVEVTKAQAEAFEVALKDFVADCLKNTDCPLKGTPDQALKQLQDWLVGLDANPIDAGDRLLNEPVAAYAVLSYLYFPSNDYPQLRTALSAAMNSRDPIPLLNLLDQRIDRGPDGRYTSNSTDAFYSVTCLDRPYAGTVDEVKKLAEEWKATAPTFGPALAWGLLACKDWPATDQTVTQTVGKGSNPILVVSTTHDPATPYAWGQLVADQLDNARLLTNDGYGHTAYMRGSECIRSAVDTYLLKGQLPEQGLVCS